MDKERQLAAFADDLAALIDRYAQEFELSTAAACGIMLLQIRLLQDELLEKYYRQKEENDEDDTN